MTTIHATTIIIGTRRLTTIQTRHLKIQHVADKNNFCFFTDHVSSHIQTAIVEKGSKTSNDESVQVMTVLIFSKDVVSLWNRCRCGRAWSPAAGFYEHGNEPSEAAEGGNAVTC